jgi:hypothetical protein
VIDMIRGQLIFAEGLGPHCAAFGAQLLITYFLASHFDVPIPVHRTPSTLQARMRAPLPLLQRPVVRLQLSVASVVDQPAPSLFSARHTAVMLLVDTDGYAGHGHKLSLLT